MPAKRERSRLEQLIKQTLGGREGGELLDLLESTYCPSLIDTSTHDPNFTMANAAKRELLDAIRFDLRRR